jgi:hypothetical protein
MYGVRRPSNSSDKSFITGQSSVSPDKPETDWAANCAEVILRRCPLCGCDLIIGHGRRRKQAHDAHYDWTADGRLLARPGAKDTLLRHLRDYLHQVCHSLGLSTRIVPHQLRHTYATEMLRAGVSFPALMKLLGHTSPEMTMQYLDVVLTDLQREFELARSKPRHLVPQPHVPLAPIRAGLDGVLESLRTAQHTLEMFRRTLPYRASSCRLRRLSNRLSKILREARTLAAP